MIQLSCKVAKHNSETIEYYCLDKCCKDNRLKCFNCLTNQHEGHKVFRISNVSQHVQEFYQKGQEIIDILYIIKFQLVENIDELIKNIQEKFQQEPNNLSQFTNDQFQSYLQGLLDFDQNKCMIDNDVIAFLQLAKNNINEAVYKLEVKESLHYQAPPEMQQKVRDLQNQGTQLFENNNIMGAQDIMNQTLILDPNNKISLVMKGKLLLSQTKNYEAYNTFDRVRKIDPMNKDALNGLGDCLRERSKYDDALKYYEATLELDKNNKQALIGKALCLGKLKKFQDARPIFERFLNQDKNDIDAIWGLADLLRIQGKDEEAIKQYNKALQLNQNHLESISGLGDCYRLLGKFDDAMKYLKKALQINPRHALSLVRMGDCLRQQKKFLEAMNFYSEALAIDRNDDWCKSKFDECKIKSQPGK
ncbi:unnamed protein product [Paramecium octaurelia]|uniref:Tetratricopeptide repeat protein n=1 Tax=Paramecium octaurelia TaxID=43137 RepID=A0A8S1XMW9_PAROT|nr:unnamed protein product [Paramecium octaurelia]